MRNFVKKIFSKQQNVLQKRFKDLKKPTIFQYCQNLAFFVSANVVIVYNVHKYNQFNTSYIIIMQHCEF